MPEIFPFKESVNPREGNYPVEEQKKSLFPLFCEIFKFIFKGALMYLFSGHFSGYIP